MKILRYISLKLLLIILISSAISCKNSQAKEEQQETVAEQIESCDYKIAVCDWMILKRQKIGAFELAHEIGSDGLELDMGSLGSRDSFDNKLRDPYFQDLFREKAKEFNIEVPSIAMSGFYGQSFVGRDNYKELVQECLDAMKVMDAKVAFLPLGVECNLSKYPEIRPELVKRLKIVGEMAENANVIIGIETSLDAAGEITLLEEIDSPGIKIYYKFQNALEAGRDLYSELRLLGKNRICQIHCTDTDGVTLPDNPRLHMRDVKKVLEEIGWCGWLVVERSRDERYIRDVKRNFTINVEYLKNIFQN